MDATVIWTAIGAAGTLAAAVVAACAALQSRESAKHANAAAEALAAIERDRRQEELKPVFEEIFTPKGGDHAELKVTLAGGGLDHIDEVILAIVDQAGVDHWAHGVPAGVTQEEAESFVWGPWEFDPAASAQVVSSRTTRPRSYSRLNGKNWDVLSLRRTRPGRWMTGTSRETWRDQYSGQPIRLLIVCRHQGYTIWTLLHEVPTPVRPRIRSFP